MRPCPFCSAENADELAVCQACGRRLPPLPPRRARNAPPTGINLPPRPAGSTAAPPPIPSAARAKSPTGAPPAAVPVGTPAPQLTPNTAPMGANTAPVAAPMAGATTAPNTASVPTPVASPGTAPMGAPPRTVAASNASGAAKASISGGWAPSASTSGATAPVSPNSTQTGVPAGPQISRESAPALPPPPGGTVDELTATTLLAPDPTLTNRVPLEDNTATNILATDDGPTRVDPHDQSRTNLLDVLSPGPAAQRREAPPTEARTAGDPSRRRSDSRQPLSPGAFARPGSSVPPPIANPAPRTANPIPSTGAPVPPRPRAPSQPPPPPFESGRARTPSAPPPSFGPPGSPPAFSRPMAPAEPVPAAPSLPAGSAYPISPNRPRVSPQGDFVDPPPTRVNRENAADRPFTPAKVLPVPEIPEPGIIHAAQYAYTFARARWQRRGAIKQLGVEIKQDTEALDQVLGALGRTARGARVEGRVFSAENSAISTAEERIAQLQREVAEVEGRKAEENSKFVDIERERNEKLSEAERMVDEAQKELVNLEAQRRSLRDRRKELERRQKAFLKSAEDNDRQAGSAPMGDQRQELRRSAEGHRREAAALEPARQDLDRQLAGLERPISECAARLDAAKAELDAAKRSLSDAREGHTHRLAELDAEQKRKAREVALADAEIQRRLVTLGTLVNLNRIEDPQFGELYERIDRLRGAITARTTEIEKLTSEREAYDRRTMNIGIATIAGALVLLIALFVIFRAIL